MRLADCTILIIVSFTMADATSAQSANRREGTEPRSVPVVSVAPRAGAREIVLPSRGRFLAGGLQDDLDTELRHNNGYLAGVSNSRGGFVVIDLDRVRFFDGAGRHVVATGKAGAGPNEIGLLTGFCVTRGDTVVAYDNTNRRLNILTAGGQLVRQIDARTLGALYPFGCFDDGTFVLGRSTDGAATRELHRYRTNGSMIGKLGTVPRRPSWTSVSVAVARQSFFVADPQTGEIRQFDVSGRLQRIFRFTEPTRELSPRELTGMGLQPRAGSSTPAPSAPVEPMLRPVFGRVFVSPSGTLWIGSFRSSVRDEDSWMGVTSSGQVLGRIVIRTDTVTRTRPPIIAAFGDTELTLLSFPPPDGAAVFETVPFRAAPNSRQ